MVASLHSKKYEYFGSLLIKARKNAGFTQMQLAQRLAVPQSFVSKYERGERRLDFTEFVEISEIIGLDVVVFISEYMNQPN
jgi:transcriptional regulator with XRE-family HTH domain